MTEFIVTVRATSVLIFPGDEAMELLDKLLDILTYEDEFAEETKTLGYLYDQEMNILYLHKGVDIEYIRKTLVNVKLINFPCHRYEEMKFEYEQIVAPRDEEQVDYINFICGQQDHSANLDSSQIFLIAGTGKGKMEPYSNKIPTPTKQGWTYMGDIKEGDYVFTEKGYQTQVLEIFDHGVQDVYEITFNDGRKARCGADHLWQVEKRYSIGKPIVMPLKDIMKTYKRPKKTYDPTRDPFDYIYKIPACGPVEYPTNKYLPINPWVLGCFITNGCLREPVLTISSGTDEIPNRIASICNYDVKKNSDYNYSYIFYHKNGKRVLTEEFFVDIPDLIYASSAHKFIPDEYMYADINTRIELIKGLMDCDGNISENGNRYHTTYSSTSKQLLLQLRKILYSLGLSGNICIDKRSDKYSNGFCGTLIFRTPHKVKPFFFSLKRKQDIALKGVNIKQQMYYNGLIIKDIKLVSREKCRCIMVDNPTHLYLTEDYIVTHNTYTSGVGISKYHLKTLIIMHRDNLRKQWLKSLYGMSGYSSKEVYELSDSQELYDIAYGRIKLDYDVYLMTHATFRAGVARIGSMGMLSKITENLGIGMKIIDEAHLEFRDTLLMDAVMNVKRNLYLTATMGRSQQDENAIFRHVFRNATFYKPSRLLTDSRPKKWVDYITVAVNTHCKPAIYQYRVAGGKGMNPASYGKWVIAYDKNKTHFKACAELIKGLYEEDSHAKVLVFMPLIDLCSDCQEYLYQRLNHDPSFDYELDIRTINSHNSKSDNERSKKADVIITTIASAGTGTDIPGITDIICCSPYCSKIVAEQVFGRIRYIPKKCHYYDIYDTSVMLDRIWLKSRYKKLKTLALNIKHIEFVEEEKE